VRLSALLLLILATFGSAAPAWAQFKDEAKESGIRFGEEQTSKYMAGAVITAANGPVRNVKALVPVPTDWPEQEVKIVNEDLSPDVKKAGYREMLGVKQLLIEVPMIGGGQEIHCRITFEVKRRMVLPPEDTSTLRVPKKAPREVLKYLGASPFIETRNREVIKLAKEAVEAKESAWDKVAAICETTRQKVEYKKSDSKGAVAALRDGFGDYEELNAVFIALCRVNDIPARTVWVQGFCYSEFYLEDEQGKGFWIPCQIAGKGEFPEKPDFRAIIQKGDNFTVPEKNVPQRFVSEHMRGLPFPGSGAPSIKWVREVVD
jgi:hypothetical protein